MPLNIRSEKVNALAERLAAATGLNKTAAVEMALENELKKRADTVPLRERVRFIQERVTARPLTGLKADKTFYDELSDDL